MAKGKYHEWLTPEGLALLEGWARDGLTDEQIADNMGIKRATLYEWKKRYPDISDTLKKGKEVIDRHVENALLKRALGYRYDEVTREPGTVEDEETGELKQVMVETKRVTKEVQGDTTAQIFWLKNRKPEQWRDKQDVQHSGSVNVNNPYKDLTTDELRKLIRDG
ncbi:helix-turn-helix domain-containing protein [Paenibacillus sp. FSL L8-0506]|uniref:helix-turn-helix domain-containing protein n=1 Tax=Paenibacillus sp. FSL L8-0506 TaxID=2975335 RepID=UPI0030F8C3AC